MSESVPPRGGVYGIRSEEIAEQNQIRKPEHREDVELAGRSVLGDRSAQRELVTRLLPQVRRTMSYFTPNRAAADDMTQVALVTLLKRIGAYRGECSLEYWASRIGIRTALSAARKETRRNRLSINIPEPRSPYKGTEESAMTHELKQILLAALQKLSDEQKAAIVLKYVEGYSVSEIAEFAEIPPNTVRIRLARGKKKLRSLLSRHKELREWMLEKAK